MKKYTEREIIEVIKLLLPDKGFGRWSEYPESDLREFYIKNLDFDLKLCMDREITKKQHQHRRASFQLKLDKLISRFSEDCIGD